MAMNNNAINWFEIPAKDFERAKKFYSAIYDYEMPVMNMGPLTMGLFPHDMESAGVGGAITSGDGQVPSSDGIVIYLASGPDLQVVLDRVEAAGGKILQPKTEVSPEIGNIAFFTDTEGNRLGLHSNG